jgi:hypothetical protein
MSNTRRALTLTAPHAGVVQRGRMIPADVVLALLPEKRSRWWVLNSFLPEKRQKLGKMVYWWEADVAPVLYVPEVLPRGQAA